MRKNVLTVLQEISLNKNENALIINQVEQLFKKLEDYWYVYDIDNNSEHKEIFLILYKNTEKSSYEDIASLFFIGIRTLVRYVKRYNNLAKKLIVKDFKELLFIL